MNPTTRHLQLIPDKPDSHWELQVAIASDNRMRVNQHFGHTPQLLVYGLADGQWTLLSVANFSTGERKHDNAKIMQRVQVTEGCQLCFCTAIGPSAVRQLFQHKVLAKVVPQGERIDSVLANAVAILHSKPLQTFRCNNYVSNRDANDPSAANKDRHLLNLLNEEWS